MPTLTQTLTDLIKMAKRAPGFPSRAPLRNGLRIDIIFIEPDTIKIQISRPEIPPSDTEWKTVINALPTPPKTIPPYRQLDNRHKDARIYLQGTIPLPQPTPPPVQSTLLPNS